MQLTVKSIDKEFRDIVTRLSDSGGGKPPPVEPLLPVRKGGGGGYIPLWTQRLLLIFLGWYWNVVSTYFAVIFWAGITAILMYGLLAVRRRFP